MADISYRTIATIGEDQPIETSSPDFTSLNYGIIMYQKTGIVFFYLKDYLGEEAFDKAMQNYFENWKFKHPDPADLQKSLESSCGKNLDWLFNDLIRTTNHIDYKISHIKKTNEGYIVTVKNAGQVNGPIRVDGIKNKQITSSQWLEPNTQNKSSLIFNGDFDYFVIDSAKNIPEVHRQNNSISTKGVFKKVEPLKLEFLIGDNEANRTNLFWTPIVAGNAYDKFMIGAALHNNGVPFNPFQFLIAPMYSFGRQMVSGIGEFSYTFLPKKQLKLSRFGYSLKSFKNEDSYKRNNSYYVSMNPYWFAKIGNRKKDKPFSNNILVQGLYRYDQIGSAKLEHAGGFVNYQMKWDYPDHLIQLDFRNDYLSNVNSGEQIGRAHITGNYSFRYLKNKMKRWIELRVFGGSYWLDELKSGTNRYVYGMSLAGTDGSQDWFTEDYFFGRSDYSGVWAKQRMENMGGFKSASFYGTTMNWMLSSNLYFQIPIKPGIFGLYADYGVFYNGVNTKQVVNTGAAIRFGKVFGVYFPFYMSKAMDDSFGNKRYADRIRFTLKLNIVNKPFNLKSLF
jgi:hypothetical protein